MFNLMSNCCSWISKLQEPVRQVTLLVVGLDNAGKTSTVNGILKEPPGDNAPTVGMVRTALKVDQFEVLLVELGGGVQARGLWKQHCGEAHGIVFVVDSSDTQRIKEARDLLTDMLRHPKKVKIEDAEENEKEQHGDLEGKEPVQDQSWQKEAKASGASGAVLPSNRVGEVLCKNPKNSEEFHEQSDRLSTKESPKKDLYRKAILALKARQEQNQ
ncbi:UNVERIFIED_CONTAM: hypothetical protein FKN15_030759 [Acipenser sinensis]